MFTFCTIMIFCVANQSCCYLAFDLICIKEVDENFKSPDVTDRQLTGVLDEVEVHQRTQGNDGGSLIASLGGRVGHVISIIISSVFTSEFV